MLRVAAWMAGALTAPFTLVTACVAAEPSVAGGTEIEVWHGDAQRVGHLGDAQDDFNVVGRIAGWRHVDTLQWSFNQWGSVPLSFRAYRRLVADGDFNIDVPIGRLKAGPNTVKITATLRDGRSLTRSITVTKEKGATPLPYSIRWSEVKNPQDVGQIVDGHWKLTPAGLRTAQVGYDRIFLIGERTWRDYDVRTSFHVHGTPPESRDAGVGLLFRFTGHVAGGPRFFPSGQPKWGYLPFGAIGWLRWKSINEVPQPHTQFFHGGGERPIDKAVFPFRFSQTYAIRFACRTLPDNPSGHGVTHYQFKLWSADEPEPAAWTWEQTQVSANALRSGGVALLAHHVDVTFGDVIVTPLP